MSLVGNLAAGGLQMHQVIAAAGGLQAAIIALRTTAVAAMATMWPYFAAIAAGAAAYYAAKEAADAMMGTVEEMDAKLERASVSIGGVTLSLAEEKEARDQAKEAIDGYRNSLSGANDELERNIELAGNQEQIEKARINADIRKRQAEIDAQSAAFTRTGGREGLSPEQAIVESQRLEEEKIKRINQAEEQQRRAEEQALQKAAENRRKDLQEMQGDNADNNAEIDGATGRYSLSKADRQALIEKGRAVETARQKYGADSAEVEAAMQEYTAAAVAMNEEERADLLRRLTLREALSKNIEAAAADLEALEQKLDKTLRDNQKEREISEIESDGQVGSSRTRSVTQIENERARQNEARQREAMAAGDRARAALRDRAEAARSGASALGKDGNAAVQAFGNDIAGALKDKELDDAELSKLSPQIRAALSSSNDTVRILAETVLEIAREQKLLQERLRNRA
jgi:hypothetical protein